MEYELLLYFFLLCSYNNTATGGVRFYMVSVKLGVVYVWWSWMQTPLSLANGGCLPGFVFLFIFPNEFQMFFIWEQDVHEALM